MKILLLAKIEGFTTKVLFLEIPTSTFQSWMLHPEVSTLCSCSHELIYISNILFRPCYRRFISPYSFKYQ